MGPSIAFAAHNPPYDVIQWKHQESQYLNRLSLLSGSLYPH
ncbi:hypothetical protein EYZ11_008038 [Aspergillus tanneri]|uniref:Uncharacterized protein n=1 Tax=Aspergillus tanneri TaxID=1220188 RepID=A0A4S3JBP6_9EURO|nr:hypothetical protein EYZ11_008038 [Aspergillus tanneri]